MVVSSPKLIILNEILVTSRGLIVLLSLAYGIPVSPFWPYVSLAHAHHMESRVCEMACGLNCSNTKLCQLLACVVMYRHMVRHFSVQHTLLMAAKSIQSCFPDLNYKLNELLS